MTKKYYIDIEVAGINLKDYPDFCDAYIDSATVVIDGVIREATDEEIEKLNEDKDLVYQKVMDTLY